MGKRDKQHRSKASAQEDVLTQSTLAAVTGIAIALNQGKGAGFFLSGPHGSGKSRLLMALRDLSATQGASPQLQAESEFFDEPDVYGYRRRRQRRQIQFVRRVFQTHRIAPCYVTLGDSSNQSLSAALQNAILRRHPQTFPHGVDLFASLDVIDASLFTSNYDMLVVLVDGLTPYLNTKKMAEALQDILFLQRLGEALPDHSITIVLAVYESIRALDNMHYHDLGKFRDRYRVLPLYIEGALARRFAVHFDEDDLEVTTPRSYYQKLQDAVETYDRVISIYPDAEWAKDALNRASSLLEELARLSRAAQQAMSRHKYTETAQLYGELLRIDPANEPASKGAKKANRIQYLISQSHDALENEEFVSAFRKLRKALQIDPTNDELRVQAEQVREKGLNALLARAQFFESEGDYSAAIGYYKESLKLSPKHSQARTKLERVSSLLAQNLRSQAKEAERQMDYAEAIRLYERALSVSPSPAKIRQELVRLRHLLAESLAEQEPSLPTTVEEAPPAICREAETTEEGAGVIPSYAPVPRIKDPVLRLAKILAESCDQDSLDFYLRFKGISGKARETQILELCISEDPIAILTDLFVADRLGKLAEYLGVEVEPGKRLDQLREAILIRLGFSVPKKPTGIAVHTKALIRLRGTLRLKDQRAEIIGIGLEGCDDVGECVLRDLIGFYCTVLMGPDYEQVLLERGFLPAKGRSGVDSLTFGQKIGLFEQLNGHLRKNVEARELMLRWFDRNWIIKNNPHVQKYLNQVSPRRNHMAHPEGIDTRILKREADEALDLLIRLFQEFEEQLIYPPVIAVEGQRIDKYGRLTYDCVDDRGRPERIFTALELSSGQEYFFYPVTNPIRVDPILVPKR